MSCHQKIVTRVISEYLFPGSVLSQRHIYLTSADANLVDKNMNTLSCLIFGCSIIIGGVIVARFNTKNPPNGGEGKFKNPLKNINVIIVVVTLAFALNQVSLAKCNLETSTSRDACTLHHTIVVAVCLFVA